MSVFGVGSDISTDTLKGYVAGKGIAIKTRDGADSAETPDADGFKIAIGDNIHANDKYLQVLDTVEDDDELEPHY